MTNTTKLALGFAFLVLSVGVWNLSETGNENPRAGHDLDSAIAYYTCPMHPSAKLHDSEVPCPICGMDLTAVPRAMSDSADQSRPSFIALSTDQQQMMGMKTEPVVEAQVSSEIRTIGRVTYDETRLVDVNLKVSGWIKDLYVDFEGKPVQKGDRLFTLYSPELVTTQEEYLLALQGLEKLKVGRGRYHEGEGNEVIEWNKRLLASARGRLHLWDFTPDQIQALESSGKRQTAVTIYAPSSGIVTDRMAVTGMHVKPDMRLYRIARLDTVWIKADVYVNDLASVRVGQRATVTLVYSSGKTFEGRVDYIYPYLNPKSRTATVRLQVPNTRGNLKPEMYTDVVLHDEVTIQLLIPESAVLFSGEKRIAFTTVGDGRFYPTEVVLGRRHSSGYEVVSGVRTGDVVVTGANFLLDSESKLKNVMMGIGGH